jgi:hypothetical protein
MSRINEKDERSVPIVRRRTKTIGLRQRAWWVMRKRRSFTLNDLLDVVATGNEGDAKSNLGKYLLALKRAGVLSVDAAKVAGGALTNPGYLRYHLEVDNGRQAPVWRASIGEVYDPNKGVSYPMDKGAADA